MMEYLGQNPGIAVLVAGAALMLLTAVLLALFFQRQRRTTAAQLKQLYRRLQSENAQAGAALAAGNQMLTSALTQMTALSDSVDVKQERLRRTLDEQLDRMQASNEKKLDEMRQVVGDKLQSTLEARLGESFKAVSGQLENVYKGLGEMRTLASGVGDLKRVLTNVKSRGIWGEVMLRSLLEECLTVGQYAENVAILPGSTERVEFAVRLPGPEAGRQIYLPIDSKFPQEDYQRLLQAQETGDAQQTEMCAQALEKAVYAQAKKIAGKYIHPPESTDFAILFLPIESLYAEVLRRPGFAEKLQREFRIVLSGPTTLSALLSSLEMGFSTLAVEKRTDEILTMLTGVRQEFTQFGEALDKAQQRLALAGDDIARIGVRTRAITRQLGAIDRQ